MHRFVTYNAPLPESLPAFSEPGFLVNKPTQLIAQSSNAFWLVGAFNETTALLDARCAFFSHNSLAMSPKQHSFGSVECTENLPDAVLSGFLDALEEAVEKAGLSGLRLAHYPRIYAPQQTDQLLAQLSKRGFRVIDEQRNFYLKISEKSFVDGLHDSARRRLGKSHRAGLAARSWPTPDLDRVINFLETSRKAQGYPLTMPADALRHWLRTTPDDYLVFAVFDHDVIAALTVAVRMRADILYNFLPADNADYRSFSPTILLTECLYTYCQTHQYHLLDLGISVDENRQPKPDLIRFKRNLGAVESGKVTLEKVNDVCTISSLFMQSV
jgi:hypothetical protein